MATTMDDISILSRAFLDAKAEIDMLETKLKIAKERLRLISEETIPGVMQELGLKNLTLDDGKKLSVKPDIYVQMSEDMKKPAFKWLNDNNFGGLIKAEVITTYGKGERLDALRLCMKLQNEGLTASFKESIHAQTLSAFLREQVAKGTNVPLALFGAKPVFKANIK